MASTEKHTAGPLLSAAETLGLSLTPLLPSELTEDADFDFIVCTSASVRKITSHPTFLAAHLPRYAYVENEETAANLESFDGYLCISDALVSFLSSVAAGFGKTLPTPGFYIDSPQPAAAAADLPALAERQALAVCYLGADWEPRAQHLLQALLKGPTSIKVHGPARGRPALSEASLDGPSPQVEYARNGIGLVTLSQDELLEDAPPRQLFDIVSAGACAICPDTPWLRRTFGEALYYYSAGGDLEAAAADVEAAFDDIKSDPQLAQSKARMAMGVFEERFSAARMLQNAVDYFERWRAAEKARTAKFDHLVIDVIVRAGGRPLAVLERAIRSLERQSTGRYRIILVCYKDLGLTDTGKYVRGRIAAVEVHQVLGANRSRALLYGLDRCTAGHFAVLDDDDYLLTSHFGNLLTAMDRSKADYRFAYSDVMTADETATPNPPWNSRLSLLQGGTGFGDIHQLLGRFSSHCFLATRNCLDQVARHHWNLQTAEDILLVCALLRIADPVHAPGATCVYSQGRPDGSAFLSHPQRREDELSLMIEVASWREVIERKFAAERRSWRSLVAPALLRAIEERRNLARAGAGEAGPVEAWVELGGPAAISARGGAEDVEPISARLLGCDDLVLIAVPLDEDRILGGSASLITEAAGEIVEVRPMAPYHVALRVDVSDYLIAGCSTVAVLEFEGAGAPLSLALLAEDGLPVAETLMPGSKRRILATVAGPEGAALAVVALQAGPFVPSRPLRVSGLWLGYRRSELAGALGETAARLSQADLRKRLEAEALQQVIGRPAEKLAGKAAALAIQGPRSEYKSIPPGAATAEGSPFGVSTGLQPWDYFAKIHLAADDLARSDWIRLRVADVKESVFALLVDAGFEKSFTKPLRVHSGKAAAEIWLPAPKAQGGAYLVLQCNEQPKNASITIVSVEAIGADARADLPVRPRRG